MHGRAAGARREIPRPHEKARQQATRDHDACGHISCQGRTRPACEHEGSQHAGDGDDNR